MIYKGIGELEVEVRSILAFDQPELIVSTVNRKVVAEGIYYLHPQNKELDRSGGALARYSIRLEISRQFPHVEPKVFETAGVFPRTANFHVNADGSCCITVWEAWCATASPVSVAKYFDGPLRNYLLGQYVRKETGKWPFEEWEHGYDGLLRAYAEALGVNADTKDVTEILLLLAQQWPKGHWQCPCGSGRTLRLCCIDRLYRLHAHVSPDLAKRMLTRLEMYREKLK